jgi:hypothetical protein
MVPSAAGRSAKSVLSTGNGGANLPPGTALQARVYPEARHGFDVSDLPPYAKFGSEIVGYNAAADAAAAREVEQFMSRKTE